MDVVQDSPWTGLGIPVKTKNPLSRTNTPPAKPLFGFELRGGWFQLKVAYDSSVIRSPGTPIRGHTRFLLALVVAALCTPIEFPCLLPFHRQ